MLDFLLGFSDTYMPLICLLFLLLFVKKISKQEIILFIYLTVNILLFAATNVMAHYSINNLFSLSFFIIGSSW